MTNVIHTAHNNSDDSRHMWRACLALKAELHIGLHQCELTEACSGIDHRKAGDSVVRTRRLRPRRTRETEFTEKLALKKMLVFSKSVSKGIIKFSHRSICTSIRKVQWLCRAESRTATFIVVRQNTILLWENNSLMSDSQPMPGAMMRGIQPLWERSNRN